MAVIPSPATAWEGPEGEPDVPAPARPWRGAQPWSGGSPAGQEEHLRVAPKQDQPLPRPPGLQQAVRERTEGGRVCRQPIHADEAVPGLRSDTNLQKQILRGPS